MSSSRALSVGPNTSNPTFPKGPTQKRILTDTEDAGEQDRGSKRSKRGCDDAEGDKAPHPKDREKRKRRRKNRQNQPKQLSEISVDTHGRSAAAEEQVASGSGPSRLHSPSMDNDASTALNHDLVDSHSRQPSVGLSSTTMGTQSPDSRSTSVLEIAGSTKGKAKMSVDAFEHDEQQPSSAATSVDAVQSQLVEKTTLVDRHTTLLSTLQQSLTCQICLDLMHKPYALAPCGHTACHGCLVSWFSAPPPDIPPAEMLPSYLRKKTCPHCRAVVSERPVEVWAVKEMVSVLVKSGLANPPINAPNLASDTLSGDPWVGIFRKAIVPSADLPRFADPAMMQDILGIQDAEDGGIYRCIDCMYEIWDGVCSSCGRLYPGHAHAPHAHLDPDEGDIEPPPDWDEDDEEANDDWIGMGPLGGLLWDWHGGANDTDVESDGSVHDSENDSTSVEIRRRHGRRRYSPVHEAVEEHERHHSGEEYDEEYESSFIDDEDDHGVAHVSNMPIPDPRDPLFPVHEESDSDDSEAEFPVRRLSRRADRPTQRHYSSEEHEGTGEDPVLRRSGSTSRHSYSRPHVSIRRFLTPSDDEHAVQSQRRRRPNVIHSDDPSDEENIRYSDGHGESDLAAMVAAREYEMYGDDGSVQRGTWFEHDDVDADELYDDYAEERNDVFSVRDGDDGHDEQDGLSAWAEYGSPEYDDDFEGEY
ncbi:uncharacterized protein FIBRA_07838 [Fibroporia radiculosa]|uniref:RING-type domain-containing protein n=1 Tax=Fibroporia radiculosa TaxID=599839 RepID=J4H4U7_9APHY|nr:uncharacterized protein FIBRA_07838 [Fibroporia radiculosa]CCM05609.1 predicted protein [Fibroporia radiculosa]